MVQFVILPDTAPCVKSSSTSCVAVFSKKIPLKPEREKSTSFLIRSPSVVFPFQIATGEKLFKLNSNFSLFSPRTFFPSLTESSSTWTSSFCTSGTSSVLMPSSFFSSFKGRCAACSFPSPSSGFRKEKRMSTEPCFGSTSSYSPVFSSTRKKPTS